MMPYDTNAVSLTPMRKETHTRVHILKCKFNVIVYTCSFPPVLFVEKFLFT